MQNFLKKLLTMLAPVLGAGAIGVCPLCWIGSASLLTYLGFGALIPWWRWIAFGFVALGAVGFLLDWITERTKIQSRLYCLPLVQFFFMLDAMCF